MNNNLDLDNITKNNINILNNLHNFISILDKIELSLSTKINENIKDLNEMKITMDENNTIFRKICENSFGINQM